MNICICDDEKKILEEITSFIKKEFPQSKVKSFSDGNSFLLSLAATEEEADLLLIDIDMPGISGMEVAAKLAEEKSKKQNIWQFVKFALFSASAGIIQVLSFLKCQLRMINIIRILIDHHTVHTRVPYQFFSQCRFS